MATLDTFATTNQNASTRMDSVDDLGEGQSFKVTAPATLTSVQFYLLKSGLPTGNITGYLQASTGSFGSSIPTEPALITGGTVDASTLTGSFALYTFTFAGNYQLYPNTVYCVTMKYSGGDGSNFVRVGIGTAGFSAWQNWGSWNGSSWSNQGPNALIFTVNGTVSGSTAGIRMLN